MVLPLGENTEGPIQPSAWAWLPPDEGDIVRIRIPIKLIEQLLARKRNQPDKPRPVRKASSPPQFTLPLARLEIPLKGSRTQP
jgi:hypothetical protein